MLSNRTSRWSMATALICVVVLAASWFLLISPRRAEATQIRGQVTAAGEQASELEFQIAQLKAEFADLDERKAELAAIHEELPSAAEIPALVRELQTMAAASGVTLNSITPGAAAVIAEDETMVAETAQAGAVLQVPINLNITGEYFEAALFLKKLQTGLSRAYLVSALLGSPAPLETSATAAATVAPTPTATASASATATAAPVATATAAAASTVETLDRMELSITGSVFVLLDSAVVLDDVTKAAKAATEAGGTAATATATPATAATAATN